ncbi:S-adenosyl-L-methionine-dependent methyltransferase [Ochromonadaceae sp. CCMP2298]|nr:S-adenosyl-L-methionine-dependent methyltransferase [Ochromonadaceae sp. CCMP2298]
MVPLVLPGERIRARVFRNHASYSEADLVEVLEASEDRVQPQCDYFASCGGCQYQHISVTAQRTWKRSQVVDVLSRIGGLDVTVKEVVGTEHVYGYRSKITPHYDAQSRFPLRIGFQQRGTRQIVDIEKCIIASEPINAKYAEARKAIQKAPGKKKGATLLFREADGGHIETDNRAYITQTVDKIKFRFRAGEFFQNNPYALSLMARHVVQQAAGHGCRFLIDTYCGSGLFSLCAADQFQHVYGVEISEPAVRAATQNALANGVLNAEFLCGSSEKIFSKVKHLPRAETVIVVDPPRKGCDAAFLEQLFVFSPRKIVYVSCDPATQARDAKSIVAEGYQVLDVSPFDLFPQTRHIENVITFVLPEVSEMPIV